MLHASVTLTKWQLLKIPNQNLAEGILPEVNKRSFHVNLLSRSYTWVRRFLRSANRLENSWRRHLQNVKFAAATLRSSSERLQGRISTGHLTFFFLPSKRQECFGTILSAEIIKSVGLHVPNDPSRYSSRVCNKLAMANLVRTPSSHIFWNSAKSQPRKTPPKK